MHIEFVGGSTLQRRWFMEAARSLEGELSWGEVWSHAQFRHWLPVIEGFPIFEQRVMVKVDWTGDPAPSQHNEWAWTSNTMTEWEQIGDVLVAGTPNAGAVLHAINGGDGTPEGLTDGPIQIPTSTIRIKQDLHTKGEELYKYVVRHELGHVIMHSLTQEEMLSLSNAFDVPISGDDPFQKAEDWFVGEGLTWAQKGKEGVAETVADLFFLGPTRGPGRWNTNRSRWRLRSEDREDDFISIIAPRLGGFGDVFTPIGHPRHPYAQNADKPPVSSGRDDPIWPPIALQTTFDWTEPPDNWTRQMFPIGGPDPTVVWYQHYISGGFSYETTSEPVDPSVDEVLPFWEDRGAGSSVVVEVNQLPGGECRFELAFTCSDLGVPFVEQGPDRIGEIFQTQQFNGVIDDLGIPHTISGFGQIAFEVHDADGRLCWLPHVKSYGSAYFPLAERFQSQLSGSPEAPLVVDTLFGEDGVIDIGEAPINMGFWLHNPDKDLEPQLAGTSLEPDSLGEPVYMVRPDCSGLKLPLRFTMSVGQTGTFGNFLGAPISAPKPHVSILHEDAFQHASPPAWKPPWPYRGEIHAEPAPPGSKLNKPVMGAPGPQVEVVVGAPT